MTPDTLRNLALTRLAPLLDERVRLRDVRLDAAGGELCLRGRWCGEHPRELRGRARLPHGAVHDERAVLLALAQALAALAAAAGLGVGVLAGIRRRRSPGLPLPPRDGG